MVIKVLIVFTGILFFLFNFWKKLKEDYLPNQIFTSGFYVLTGILIFEFLSLWFFPEWWFWLGFLGSIIGASLAVYRFKLRIFETIEALVISLLSLVASCFLVLYLSKARGALMAFFAAILFYLLFILLDKQYKSFRWYKSGRLGFSGMAVLALFFLIRCIIAIFFNGVVSFVGNDALFSGIVSFVSFLMLYNLSRSKI